MPHPKVLVLLAARNGSAWIVEQVDTILDQVGVDVALLISDDASTDDTLRCLGRYTSDARVRVTSTPAATGAASQNFLRLIRSTSPENFDFISLADQDDRWSTDKLRRACTAMGESGAGGYSCATTAFWPDGSRKVLRQVGRVTDSDFLFEGAGQGCTYVMTAVFYARMREFILHQYADTDSLHYHDWAIYALSRMWRIPWFFDALPMIEYRQHGGNDTGARGSFAGVLKRIERIRSGWYAQQLREVARMCMAADPRHPIVTEWTGLLGATPRARAASWKLFWFCCKGGRRRSIDKTVLLAAVLAGWI